jgi:hypothetical protein
MAKKLIVRPVIRARTSSKVVLTAKGSSVARERFEPANAKYEPPALTGVRSLAETGKEQTQLPRPMNAKPASLRAQRAGNFRQTSEEWRDVKEQTASQLRFRSLPQNSFPQNRSISTEFLDRSGAQHQGDDVADGENARRGAVRKRNHRWRSLSRAVTAFQIRGRLTLADQHALPVYLENANPNPLPSSAPNSWLAGERLQLSRGWHPGQ